MRSRILHPDSAQTRVKRAIATDECARASRFCCIHTIIGGRPPRPRGRSFSHQGDGLGDVQSYSSKLPVKPGQGSEGLWTRTFLRPWPESSSAKRLTRL